MCFLSFHRVFCFLSGRVSELAVFRDLQESERQRHFKLISIILIMFFFFFSVLVVIVFCVLSFIGVLSAVS